jgi:hypothetical protein
MSEWRTIDSAPMDGTPVLVHFTGAGPIVAFRRAAHPDQWVRYLGFGKSNYWPSVHVDNSTAWMPLPPPPEQEPT